MRVWEIMRAIVKDRARSQGVKQKYLAEQCGIPEKTFSLIVNGRKPITDGIIQQFCDGMQVNPNDLFTLAKQPRAG